MKRILSLFLAILMLLSSATLLFSCGNKAENESGTEDEVKKYDEDSIFYERSLVSDDLEPRDFGGRKFRVVAYTPKEIYIEEEDRNQGDLLKDATFQAVSNVENRFNVEVDLVYSGDYIETRDYISKTILASSDEFDLTMGHVLETANIVEKGLFLNWYDIENINFSKPWWLPSTTEDLAFDGKCILALSHLTSSAVGGIGCLYFNKALAASYELGNLYEIVMNGDWTFDVFMEMVKDVYTDNGNDKRDEGDFFGMTQESNTFANGWLWAFDNPICAKNAEGIPELVLNSDKIDNIINDIYNMCYNTPGVWCDYFQPAGAADCSKLFFNRQAIFMQSTIGDATSERLRNFEDDYGLLPMPKYDENQKDYHSFVGGWHSVLAVPKTVTDTEFVGTIVEALSAEKWKIYTPTIYEIALKTRYLRDNESKEVLDMIIDGVRFDFGYIGNIGFSFIIEEMLRDGNNNFQSYFKKKKTDAKYQLKQMVKAYNKLS